MGHTVTVYTSHKSPPLSSPRYIPAGQISSMPPVDVLIAVKEWRAVLQRLRAKKRIFWTGDGFEQYSNFGLGDKRVIDRTDAFFAASRWHAESLCAESGFPLNRACVIGNGVHLPYFSGTEPRVRKRLIYSSSPNRGLEYVPVLFQELRKHHPDVELHVFAGLDIYNTDRPYAGPEVAQLNAMTEMLKKIPNCHVRGNVTQKALAREFMRSGILFYPLKVPETCCITALEAQVAGCVPIVSAMGTLAETVGSAGVLVPGTPGSKEHLVSFLNATHTVLSDDALWRELSTIGMEQTRGNNSWPVIATRFDGYLRQICGSA